MPIQISRVSFEEHLLQRLAVDLLSGLRTDGPEAIDGDLSGGLVLLPSARACKTLGRILHQESGRDTLLLPRILTDEQWAVEIALGLGKSALELPDDRVRPILLATGLADGATNGQNQASWLAGRQENAPALAEEFVAFFDEVRRHRLDQTLLEPKSLESVLALAGAQEAEIIAADLGKAHQVWELYRRVVPVDRTDFLVDLSDILVRNLAAGDSQPGRSYDLVFVAGFGRVDPVRADLLRAALTCGREGHLYLPTGDSFLSRLFLATWDSSPTGTVAPGHPLAPSQSLEAVFRDGDEESAVGISTVSKNSTSSKIVPSLLERLTGVGDVAGLTFPNGPLELLPCGDPEAESRVVADRVASLLEGLPDSPDSQNATPRIAVAVNDPSLAARIFTQLTDAGIDPDTTHGQPLSVQPAGLLLRFILRAALTNLRAEPLLEVLTHPYVKLDTVEAGHGHWTLQLEQMFRRDTGPEGGLSGLHRRAQDRDQAALNLFGRRGPGLVNFVTTVADAFAPLLEFKAGRDGSWRDLLEALGRTWNHLSAERLLLPGSERHDIQAAAKLVQDLRRESDRLPRSNLAEFTADLGRLLTNENVPPHRPRNLPVLLTGLVEARLERFDHLILAGMREGSFPAKSQQPLFLPGRVRYRLGLPVRQDFIGRDAELFLRLLHNADHVLITWPDEDANQPVLPSPFVSRLMLGLGNPGGTAAGKRLWRNKEIPWKQIIAENEAFFDESSEPPAYEATRPMPDLSWSALRVWRDCPYRFLLERGFALRKPEEVRAEFSRMEYGRLVHGIMQSWLDPSGPGYKALTEGDREGAHLLLGKIAAEEFLPGSAELPVRKLWLDSFSRSVPSLVDWELFRFQQWRPVALEARFRLQLSDFMEWAVGYAQELGHDPDPSILPDYAAGLHLIGTIDRIDRALAGEGSLAVIDYKTGRLPSVNKVKKLEDLQVLLYAAAVEAGALQGADGCPITGQVSQGLYYSLSHDKVGAPGKPHLDTGDDEGRLLLLEGVAELVRLALEASNPAGPFPLIQREQQGLGSAQLPCRYCDFRGLCRLEERPYLESSTRSKLDMLVGTREGFAS